MGCDQALGRVTAVTSRDVVSGTRRCYGSLGGMLLWSGVGAAGHLDEFVTFHGLVERVKDGVAAFDQS